MPHFVKQGFLVLGLILATQLPLAAQPVQRGRVLPSPGLLNRYGLELGWWNQAVLDPSRDVVQHLTADEEVVFVQSSAGTVTAFDFETGIKLWAVQLGRSDSPSQPVASNEKLAFVVAGLGLFALDKWSGDLVWQLRLPSSATSSPAVDDKHLYIGMLDGSVYALDLKMVRELYEGNYLPDYSYQTIKWRYRTGGRVKTQPVPLGAVVFFASNDSSLYAVTTEDRSPKFQLETDAPVSAALASEAGLVFLASKDFNVYAVNQVSGQIRWRFVSGLPITTAPLVVGDDLFIAPERGGVYLISAATGREKAGGFWPTLQDPIAVTDHYFILRDRMGNVVLVNRATNGIEGVLPLSRFQVHHANDRTDRLVLATKTGMVVMIREQGREFPIYYRHPERKPILPELAPETPEGGEVEPGAEEAAQPTP